MGNLQSPENYNMKDLYIDVSLKTCINGSAYDFTGKKTFDTSFYRENIGFGITDINIEISTSLQPVIDITFKDLYGNTAFGTQRGYSDGIDSSVLFNWPPPKFRFSFKGYLGRRVTWLLNLKTTNVAFVPSDGSYEIKCTFVPNQWGFLADLPALYLFACKRLRYEAYGNKEYEIVGDNCVFGIDSVFSYIKIGKRVEIKTEEVTKQFDLLLKQLGGIKYRIANEVCGSKNITLGQEIIGIVNNVSIPDFVDLKVVSPNKELNELVKLFKDSGNINKLNTFLQANLMQKDGGNNYVNVYKSIDWLLINGDGGIRGISNQDLQREKVKIFKIVDNNINAIDNDIKRRIFSSSKSQISKLTIGEVFRQLSRDSAFILGSILQAGFEGYEKNKDKRDGENGKKELIGKCFPLYINEKGEEIPATTPSDVTKYGSGPSTDYGVAEYEMLFVDKFIESIGEGIAVDLVSEDVAESSDGIIKNRINNLEGIRPNPYKPFYSNIAENILIRSGIIAFITRSSDPSRPGDYPNNSGFDRDGSDAIASLSVVDMDNLNNDMLTKLSFEDNQKLKRFCTFFNNFISDDSEELNTKIGENILNYDGGKGAYFDDDSVSAIFLEPIPTEIYDHKVKVNDSPLTLREIISELFFGNGTSASQNAFTSGNTFTNSAETGMFYNSNSDENVFLNKQFIDKDSLCAVVTSNNGLYWNLPTDNADKYVFVLFDNPADALKTKEINVSDATSIEDIEKGEDDPVGYVQISQYKSSVDGSEKTHAITLFNRRVEKSNAVNYSAFKTFYPEPGYTNDVDNDMYLQKRYIQRNETISNGDIPAQNLSVAVYTHMEQATSVSNTNNDRFAVFGPFYKPYHFWDVRARNQRVAIKTMCKTILKKLNEIETQKSEVMASIFGKANESREALYKQMHTIFHQWQIMASSIIGREFCNDITVSGGENLGKVFEREFGMCDRHQPRKKDRTLLKDYLLNNDSNTLFVYDYPLAPVRGEDLDVRKSIINIDALYKPNGNTTVLNLIQQICTKNNFIFVPFPGDANSDNINEIYKPFPVYPGDEKIMNYFHVIYTPTPETRSKLSNDGNELISDYMNTSDFQNDAISVSFGSINNQIVKNINVGTDYSKPTAESILNLQRLVDKENSDHKVAMDCSMLPIYEGRSFTAKIDMIGNAQVYPMQYFYLEKMPMFQGLYQIMKVSHSITPNDMSTSVEGIRMRFDVLNKSYGGIPPITLDDLERLGDVAMPRISASTFSNRSAIPSILGGEDISQEFIEFIKTKDYKITSLRDMDAFVFDITKGKYSTFLSFFNATQSGTGEFVIPKDGIKQKLNEIRGAYNNQNLKLFNSISVLSTKADKTLNPLEAITMWELTLSESGGKGVNEGGGLAYFFETTIPGLGEGSKQSYNLDSEGRNKTLYSCLMDSSFKKRFSSSSYTIGKDLFVNPPSWTKGTKFNSKYGEASAKNVVYHADFAKFRGRGYIQNTFRTAYSSLLSQIKNLGNSKINAIINTWRQNIVGAETNDKLLTVSTNNEWDALFAIDDVQAIAYKEFLKKHASTSGFHTVDPGQITINLNNNLGAIKAKITSICMAPSWTSHLYGYNNYSRIAQICNTLITFYNA
jgi:hypothetical protein